MQDIKVSRYKNPDAIGWAGYLEPADLSWIAFVGLDGRPRFFLNRDPTTGAILGADPSKHVADLERLRTEPGLRIGMREDGSGWDGQSSLAVGERVFPLGEDGRGEDVVPRVPLVS